jgi:ribosomal protein S11
MARIIKKAWRLPRVIKKYKKELRSNKLYKMCSKWGKRPQLIKPIALRVGIPDTSKDAIKYVRSKIPNPRFEFQYKAYLRRLKAQEDYYKHGVKNKARKDGKPLRVFMPKKYNLSDPRPVVVKGHFPFTFIPRGMYKVLDTKEFTTPYKTRRNFKKYDLERLKSPYNLRKTKLLWARNNPKFRFRRAIYLQKPYPWVRFIPKINNCYSLVVRPDKTYYQNILRTDNLTLKKFKRRVRLLKISYKLRKRLEDAINPSFVARFYRKNVKYLYKKFNKLVKKAGYVYTVKSAGVHPVLKGTKRVSPAAAQDLGLNTARYLRKIKMKKVHFDSLIQYHFRYRAFMRGFISNRCRIRVVTLRSLAKIPHSKGLRRPKKRRT